MELWLKLSILSVSIAVTLTIVSTVILSSVRLYKKYRHQASRPRHVDLEESILDDTLAESPPFNSWVSSWSWLRRYSKSNQPVSILNSETTCVDPLSLTLADEPSTSDVAGRHTIPYTLLNVDLERVNPDVPPPRLDRSTDQKRHRGRREYTHWRVGKTERTPLLPRSRSVSPYKPTFPPGRGGPYPIDIPKKLTERPTFPLPEKLVWKKLTPFEKAGMVWWRN